LPPPEGLEYAARLPGRWPDALELARLEHSLFVIAKELERTRRRTNALEYVVIPEMQASRKEVEQKIGELERSDVSRLMKVKEMLEEAERVRLGK